MIGYLMVGGAGFIFLVASYLLGGLFEAAHGALEHDVHIEIGGHDAVDVSHDGESQIGPSFFSIRVLAAFITGFGMVGALFTNYGWEPLPASLPGIGAGALMAFIMYGFSVLLYRQQGSSGYRPEELVGKTAETVIPIPENGLGQVVVPIRGGNSSLAARSEDGVGIPSGKSVQIVGFSGTTAIVKLK